MLHGCIVIRTVCLFNHQLNNVFHAQGERLQKSLKVCERLPDK